MRMRMAQPVCFYIALSKKIKKGVSCQGKARKCTIMKLNNYENEEKLVSFVLKKAFGKAKDFSIEDADLDRVYFSMEGHEYTVRMWNINENKIDWTLFKCVDHHEEAIIDGCYYYSCTSKGG